MKKRRFSQLLSLVLGVLRFPFVKSKYNIKKGYIHREKYFHFLAIQAKDEGQKEVYEAAREIAKKENFNSVIDVGCGSAFKLINQFSEKHHFIGIDIKETFAYLSNTYPQYDWRDGETIDYSTLKADLVICSDVIEHMVDPDALLQNIRLIQNLKLLALSTPDRLLARGWFDFGPPHNPTHIREWNGKEFATYVESQGFDILYHQITRYNQHTQMLTCKPKNI